MCDDPPARWETPWPEPDEPAAGYPVLEGVEHTEIYHASAEEGVYSHHPQIAWLDGWMYASWSSHRDGEDGPGQRVLHALGRDGRAWTKPAELFPAVGPVREATAWGRVLTANGWVSRDETMYAIAEVHDNAGWRDPESAYTSRVRTERCLYRIRVGHGRVARAVMPDGVLGPIFWLVADPPDPHAGFPLYPDARGRFAAVAHDLHEWLARPLNEPAWEFRRWTTRPRAEDGDLLCEPTTFRRPDGALVRLARHLGGSQRLYAALSEDDGKTWAPFVRTNIPDSPSKSVAGSPPDGRVYLVGNQTPRPERDPLVIGLSDDGITFDRAAAIRHDAPKMREPGLHKGPGLQYPSVVVADDALVVIYSVNKEDVAISRVPLDALP